MVPSLCWEVLLDEVHNAKLSACFGYKKMLYCLLVFGGPRCKNHVREFVNSAKFVNMLKTVHNHPQDY